MAYTMEKTNMVAKQTILRLKRWVILAGRATESNAQQSEFLAAHDRARAVYNEFQNMNTQTLLDESSEIWVELCNNVIEIDELFCKMDGVFVSITSEIERTRPISNPSSGASSAQSKNNVKLPQIQLPHFDGTLTKWRAFHDLYISLIHDNDALSNIEKFQYLATSVSKEPLAIVERLPITADNYPIVYAELVEHYQNDRTLATLYWKTICNAPNLATNSPQALRNLLTTFNENITALNKVEGLNLWDFTLFNWLLKKLDSETRQRFELNHATTEFPVYATLRQFLGDQCRALERDSLNTGTYSDSLNSNNRSHKSNYSKFKSVSEPNRKPQVFLAATSNETIKPTCLHCKGHSHVIFRCPNFLELTPYDRFLAVKSARLCHNCLGTSHQVKSCPSRLSCRHCASKHNSLLHFNKLTPPSSSDISLHPDPGPSSSEAVMVPSQPIAMSATIDLANPRPLATVLLSTVLLEVRDRWGNFQVLRALCDSGSQSSFLTERCRKLLGLPFSRSSVPISCLGHTSINSSRGCTDCQIRPVSLTKPSFEVVAVVLPTICSKLPSSPLLPSKSFDNLKLADPHWYLPGAIDMLLGADIFASIVQDGFIAGDGDRPAAMNTVFGWALLGTTSCNTSFATHSFFVSTEPALDDTLKRFWKIEEVPSKLIVAPEDNKAETVFKNSHFRDKSGRFGVSLPFRDITSLSPAFEGSIQIADRRLLALERRLSRQPSVQDKYLEFMKDYLVSGHMSKLSKPPSGSDCYFIPHHCVFKDDGNSSKIRVVFDASAKAHNGNSLNDSLLVGPKLQNDIATILLRFRSHKFVFTCDIRQMYRQILVTEPQRKYQLIRWRPSPLDPIETYQLNTVTYGVASSPYLAIRCLLQLAHEGQEQFPLASQAIRSDLYVDDFASGTDSLQAALELKSQLITLLETGCFELRKWAANHPLLLEHLPPEHCQVQGSTFDGASDSMIKILGLQWQASSDSLAFSVKPIDSPCTKRSILSEVAKIYDPLGFLCPLIFFAKRLVQHLWALGLDWDSQPPDDVCAQWRRYKSLLHVLCSLKIPRSFKPSSVVECQLHAFCDASESGYACVVYFRFVDDDGNIHVSFVIAKSKVAPLQRLSIPRLELCAAVLLSNVVQFVIETCGENVAVSKVVAWSDSTVALSWIRSSPHRWKTFVANRVSHIQDRISPSCWRHIRSGENPADPASRGLLPDDLLSCSLWWAGPSWLRQSPELWPSDVSLPSASTDVDGEARKVVLVAQVEWSDIDVMLNRFSSLRKIEGVIAYCFRFVNNVRRKDKVSGVLTAAELQTSLFHIVKYVQTVAFKLELSNLRSGHQCSKYLAKLSPFIDNNGVLRVGGRLAKSDLSFDAKHPALLPRNHRLSELLIMQIHHRHMHAGVNTTMYLLQQNFWILSARRAIRSCLAKCYRCFRTRPLPITPPMGDLPALRVSQLKAFSCVGVDYGGPFPILLSRRRGSRTQKAYVCLFICFATKAIHIEIASDLSSETFLAALRRFIARRGRCSRIFSDCGTNFVGAHKELNAYMKLAVECEAIEWHFNPPSAPHFGGLWEGGIKAVKTHLARVIGTQILTYEELNTVGIQIEALLNSRPLCSDSSDPNDLRVLTPGHFLTLEPLTAAPDPDLSHLKLSRLSRWQLVQRMQQDFWKRWRNEYLHNFHQRAKWAHTHRFEPVDVGTLVLLKDDLTPPLQWRLGRIEKLHPGADKIARVATIRTNNGLLKRPFVKLCPVPSQ